MGNAQTKMYDKLHSVLPGRHDGWEECCDLPKASRHLLGENDRKQFIHAIITVITANGKYDLSEHDFRLLYSRRPNDRFVARIVAQKAGVVTNKIETDEDGKDQGAAFKALRRHIERRLDRILQDLPEDEGMGKSAAGSSSAARGDVGGRLEGERRGNVPADEPPTYRNVMGDERTSHGAKKG